MRRHPSGLVALDAADVLQIAEAAIGRPAVLRDRGLLLSALGRPSLSAFGADVYPSLEQKVAAHLHGLARNHALLDGNKRTAWVSSVVFARINGLDIAAPEQQDIVDLVVAAAQDQIGVPDLATALQSWARPLP